MKFPASSPPSSKARENAKRAGFDGVEIHGANGYLLDQFLQDSTNHRSDAYGGTREKRARLMLEVADACVEVWGADRVGMHLAPRADSHDMGDSDRLGTFTYVARELGKRGLAFLCAREKWQDDSIGPAIKEAFGGVLIANEGFDFASANRRWPRARPMPWRSANCPSPIPICRSVSRKTRRSMPGMPALSMYGGAKGYTDYPIRATEPA